MHRFIAALSSVALLGLIVPACGGGNDEPAVTVQSLEQVCTDLVKRECTALTSCCKNSTTFDNFECTRQLLGDCLSGSEGVHAGNVIYNAAAQEKCDGSIAATCPDATVAPTATDESITIACKNVVTGYRPLGSECTASSQCVAVGDGAYPSCYQGSSGSSAGGVCAKHVFGDTCGFDPATLTVTKCHAAKYCNVSDPPVGTKPAGGVGQFYYKGTCVAPAVAGQPCGQVIPNTTPVPCEAGLGCGQVSGMTGKQCVKPHALGEDCKDNFACAAGLACTPMSSGAFTCQGVTTTGDGAFCFKAAGAGGSGGSAGSSSGGTGGM